MSTNSQSGTITSIIKPALLPFGAERFLLFGRRPAGTHCHQGDEEENTSRREDDVDGTSSLKNME